MLAMSNRGRERSFNSATCFLGAKEFSRKPGLIPTINSHFRPRLKNQGYFRPERLVFDLKPCIVVFDQRAKLSFAFDREEEFSTVAAENPRNDGYVRTFQEKTVPTDTRLAGWAALVQTFGVQAPVR